MKMEFQLSFLYFLNRQIRILLLALNLIETLYISTYTTYVLRYNNWIDYAKYRKQKHPLQNQPYVETDKRK